MMIGRTSKLTGDKHVMDINVTAEQLAQWRGGELIQVACPNLTADEREFIMSGITPQEWEEYMN